MIIGGYLAVVLLWVLYIQVMAALRVWNTLHWIVKAHLLPIAVVFIVLDVGVNAIVGTVIFIELPRWWTLSERLNYHATQDHGWRASTAEWICDKVLNPFDPDGHHCGARQ